MGHIHIILLTAKGQEFDRQRGQEVGADLYMTKPFDPDALIAKARSVLGLRFLIAAMPGLTLRSLFSPRSKRFRCYGSLRGAGEFSALSILGEDSARKINRKPQRIVSRSGGV